MTALKFIFQRSLILCAFFVLAGNSFAQDFDAFAETINRGNAEQKRETLRVIRNLESEPASRLAVPALRDSSEIVRATAAFSVIFLPADEAFTALSPLLSDKKELVRREAAYALGKTRNPNAVAALLRVFQKDKIAEVRNAAIVALGEIGDAAAIDGLTQILRRKPKNEDDADDFLRRAAARSVGQIAQIIQTGKTEVITPQILSAQPKNIETVRFPKLAEQFPVFRPAIAVLINISQNNNESGDARREAAFALGVIGDAAAIPALQANLNDQDYYLAQISREALRKIEVNLKVPTVEDTRSRQIEN
jgi:HEAT repeat protein